MGAAAHALPAREAVARGFGVELVSPPNASAARVILGREPAQNRFWTGSLSVDRGGTPCGVDLIHVGALGGGEHIDGDGGTGVALVAGAGALVDWKPPVGSWSDNGVDPRVCGIASGEKCGAGWRTDRLNIVVFENRPGFREPVNVRGLDLPAAVESAIRITQVVDQKEDDVGLGGGCTQKARTDQKQTE